MSRSRFPSRSYFVASSASEQSDDEDIQSSDSTVIGTPPSPDTTVDYLSPKLVSLSPPPIQSHKSDSPQRQIVTAGTSERGDDSSSNTGLKGRRILNCDHCRKRKSRCDRVQPRCGECTSRELDCCWSISLAPQSPPVIKVVIPKPRSAAVHRPIPKTKPSPIITSLPAPTAIVPNHHFTQLLAFSSVETNRLAQQIVSPPVVATDHDSVSRPKTARSAEQYGPTSKRGSFLYSPVALPTRPHSAYPVLSTASEPTTTHSGSNTVGSALLPPLPVTRSESVPELVHRLPPPVLFISSYSSRPNTTERTRSNGLGLKSAGLAEDALDLTTEPKMFFLSSASSSPVTPSFSSRPQFHHQNQPPLSVTSTQVRHISRRSSLVSPPSAISPRAAYGSSCASAIMSHHSTSRRPALGPFPSPPLTQTRQDHYFTSTSPAAQTVRRPTMKRQESTDMTIDAPAHKRRLTTTTEMTSTSIRSSSSLLKLPSIRSLFLLRDPGNDDSPTLYQSVSIVGGKRGRSRMEEPLPSIRRWYPSHTGVDLARGLEDSERRSEYRRM